MSFIDGKGGSLEDTIEARVCIIGAGAAGITIADELTRDGSDVLLIESGDRQLDSEVQALYAGENVGLPYYGLTGCRLRYFGGTTNHWAGYCRANDPINYEGRPDLGVPAWPFSADEAMPWLDRAAKRLDIDSRFFEPSQLLRNVGFEPDDSLNRLGDEVFVAVNQKTSIKRFAEHYAPALDSAPNVRVVTNLNLVGIHLSENGSAVQHLECQTLQGRKIRVKAGVFVLACHAIENARMLLVSQNVAKGGIGNDHGMVGRYFTEHPQLYAGLMIAGPRFQNYFDRRHRSPQTHIAAMSLAPEAMRRHDALSYHMHFTSEPARAEIHRAARRLFYGLGKPFSTQIMRDAVRVLTNITELTRPEPGPIILHPSLDGSADARAMWLNHTFEQAPNPDSRVRLSTIERDALGLPRVELEWRLSEQDLHTVREGQRILSAELSAIGFGRFVLEELDWPLVQERVQGHFHHYSTTRMSNDPRLGVVDADQRVHGVSNLFVAGSSVFPNASAHGPTLHIVAFSLRLADHLRRNLRRYELPQ